MMMARKCSTGARPQASGAGPARCFVRCTAQRSSAPVACSASKHESSVVHEGVGVGSCAPRHAGAMKALAVAASLLLTANAAPVWAGTPGGRPLPPIDPDPKRCERGFTGNTIGQANAVSDRILDLRKCDYVGANLSTKVLAGALLSDADLSKSNLQEAVLTKAYAVGAIFQDADMTNAVVDRVDFSNANLKGVKLVNAVVTGSIFEGADLGDSVWEDALVGGEDVKRLCANPTLVGESRVQVGCRK